VAASVRFVGRERELSRLQAALDGDTRMLLVVGDAGIGKSRRGSGVQPPAGSPSSRLPVPRATLSASCNSLVGPSGPGGDHTASP